jgi:hypothetical protein
MGLLMLIGCHFSLPNYSQEIVKDVISSNTTVYSKEWAVAFLFNTNGLGVGTRFTTIKNTKTAVYRDLNFSAYTHPQQVKTSNPYYQEAQTYYFGKENSFYALKAGWGIASTLSPKPLLNGVKLSINTSIGTAIGLEKPTYLQIIQPDASFQNFVLTTERYAPEKHFSENIYGGASWFKGIEQTQANIGFYSQVSLNMEFGLKNSGLYALETGFNLDYYPSGIALMAFQAEHTLFLAFNLSLWVGRRR